MLSSIFSATGNLALEGLSIIGIFLRATWWFWAFFILVGVARSTWLYWRQEVFKKVTKFSLLEIKIPREILKSPRSMDQLLQSVNSLLNIAGNLGERYGEGEVTVWYSFEMVSFGGQIHFYVRCYHKQRILIEAAFFSFYPDIEIIEVPDYTKSLPQNHTDLDLQEARIYGTEMFLKKPGAYPLKTYVEFENPAEEHQFDQMSVFMEVLGKVKKDEFVGIQFNLAPTFSDWGKRYKDLVEKLREPKYSKTETKAGKGDLDMAFRAMLMKSPGETDVLKAVERNVAKPAFFTVIRYIYLAPRVTYYESFPKRAIRGAFGQYGSADLNSLIANEGIQNRVKIWDFPYIFPKSRRRARAQRLLQCYINRYLGLETFMGMILTSHIFNWNIHTRINLMNTESLASLFHPPSMLVLTAPHTERIESRKVGAPAGLPIYGDESALDKFKGEGKE